jgi:hypothetical protein
MLLVKKTERKLEDVSVKGMWNEKKSGNPQCTFRFCVHKERKKVQTLSIGADWPMCSEIADQSAGFFL